ncbi:MAG: endonuclease/exonuclease/phosphatase family protein [Bryobacteraceae bacterium]
MKRHRDNCVARAAYGNIQQAAAVHMAEQNHNQRIRIVAYNFLSGGSRKRNGHWSRVVRAFAPELVLAQECRPPVDSPGERFRPDPSNALLWHSVVGRRWGSALFARSGPVSAIPVAGYDGWVVGGEVQRTEWSNGRPLRVFSIHAPAGERGYIRTMHEILDRIALARAGADVILGGDFNVVVGYRLPHERLKVTRGERGILDRLVQEFGLVSCWQAAHPNRPLAQTLRWSANRQAPYHCDGIFVPSSWLDRLVSCRVVRGSRWNALSDHNPVVAEFRSVFNRHICKEEEQSEASLSSASRSPRELRHIKDTSAGFG